MLPNAPMPMKISNSFRRLALLSALGAAFLFSAAPLSAEPLFSETWEGLRAGDNIMKSRRWTMGQGSAEQLVIVENPAPNASGLFLTSLAGDAKPVMLSIDRFTLGDQGLAVSAELALTREDGQLQLGIRNADAGGGSIMESYRIRVTGKEVFLNRFPAPREGKQKLLGSHAYGPGEFKLGEFHTFMMKVSPLSEEKTRVEVLMDGKVIITSTASLSREIGVPRLGSSVRVFFLPDSADEGLVRKISVSREE